MGEKGLYVCKLQLQKISLDIKPYPQVEENSLILLTILKLH